MSCHAKGCQDMARYIQRWPHSLGRSAPCERRGALEARSNAKVLSAAMRGGGGGAGQEFRPTAFGLLEMTSRDLPSSKRSSRGSLVAFASLSHRLKRHVLRRFHQPAGQGAAFPCRALFFAGAGARGGRGVDGSGLGDLEHWLRLGRARVGARKPWILKNMIATSYVHDIYIYTIPMPG